MHQEELLTRVRQLFSRALEARFEPGPHGKRMRAQGYADGYMRALLDAGLVDQHTLLDVIGGERRKHSASPAQSSAADAA